MSKLPYEEQIELERRSKEFVSTIKSSASPTQRVDECAFSLGNPPRWDVQRLVVVARTLASELEAAERDRDQYHKNWLSVQDATGERCLMHAVNRIHALLDAERQIARYREKYGELE